MEVFGNFSASAQDYDNMWKQIDILVNEDKPKSIIDAAEKIYAKAKKEQNFPQMLKAQICITERKCDLDPELFLPQEYEKCIDEIEKDAKLSHDEKTARKSLTHCMLASAYANMHDSYIHDFDQETREQFPIKAKEHIFASLESMTDLAKIDCQKYVPLLTIDSDSRFFNHDLLHPIFSCALSNNFAMLSEEEKYELYKKVIDVYQTSGNREGANILKLNFLKFRNRSSLKSILLNNQDYQKEIRALYEESKDLETNIDVAIALANMYDGSDDEKLEFIRTCITRWCKSPTPSMSEDEADKVNTQAQRANAFKNLEASIMSTSISIKTGDNIFANQYFALNISYYNATEAKLHIRGYAGSNSNNTLKESGKLLDSRTYDLPLDEENLRRRDNNLPHHGEDVDTLKLPAGHYALIAEANGTKVSREMKITSIRAVSIAHPDKKSVIVTVLDNVTGRPVENASILLFNTWEQKFGTKYDKEYRTDKNGEVVIKNFVDMNVRYAMAIRNVNKYGTYEEDCTESFNPRYNYDSYTKSETKNLNTYTDRSIYRPGQTVHCATIAYWQHGDSIKAIDGEQIQVRVVDPDYKEVYKGSIKTNEFGSASFDFVIPKESKLGQFYIHTNIGYNSGNAYFSVEEYKRPTFEVTFDEKQKDTKHSLGERFNVVGNACMFSGVPNQGAKVKYTIEWTEVHHWYYGYHWQELQSGECATDNNGAFSIEMNAELPEVVYSDSIAFRIKAEVTDIAGEMERGYFDFKVKNPNYKEPEKSNDKPDNSPKDIMTCSENEISEDKEVTVTFKAQENDALVHYYIISKTKIEEHNTKVLNGDELKFSVRYKKEWEDGVTIAVFYVRNGHIYYSSRSLPYVTPQKRLNLTWKTFRDNLIPGQKEQWTLTVKDYNGKTIPGAELMAVMYDASLEKIRPHHWDFTVDFARYLPSANLIGTRWNDGIYIGIHPDHKSYTVYNRTYDLLKAFVHQRWYRARYKNNNAMYGMVESAPMVMRSVAMDASGMAMAKGIEEMVEDKEAAEADENASDTPSKNMRTNLEELAFFYPHLLTDNQGEAHIAFTLPDCLTEWKFMGIVHSKDIQYGTISATATAKKDFMIQPNMPRFLRAGDKAVISAKVINLCDKDIIGKATLRILDAESEREVMTETSSFKVSADNTTSVSFSINEKLEYGDYICEFIATDGIASDGERNRLPVLSTKVEVVENVPFYLDGASTKSIDLSTIYNQNSKSVTDKQIEIGFTDNPALPVFNSLKALQNPTHDNAPCYAAALYSNSVMLNMSHILGEHLTDFDASNAKATADKALKKLKKLQTSSGAWSWFEGMEPSFYITLTVVEDLVRLRDYLDRHEEKCPSEIKKMIKDALKYLDKEELKDFKERKNRKWSLRPYDTDIRYLSVCENPDKEMKDCYLTEMVKDFRNLTIYGRSQGVLILKKFGRDADAKKFLESVKEYTMYKEGFGRYFATDLAYYSWMDYRIPTQLAAMRGITAYEKLNKEENHQYLIDMQLWLLRQKQTQVWHNVINALDVADFLLTNNPEVSLHEITAPALVLDGTTVKLDTIYNDIPEVKTLQVTKTSPGISWGHVRSKFQEEVSNLNSYSSGELTIERKVIRDGNKVVIRLILHADRDMDFVTVMSQHAACLEPMRTLSGYQRMGGRGCYLEVHDSHIDLFFNKFTRGTTTIDMEYYIAREGEYNSGYASIECSYAPEFGAHTKGERMSTK